jgi:hypothetical protein
MDCGRAADTGVAQKGRRLMFPIDDIPELHLVGVSSRGEPNRERVIIRNPSDNMVALGEFALLVGFKTAENIAVPLPDQFLWFGDELLGPRTWLFIYTGPGKPTSTRTVVTDEPARVLHWGRKHVMFDNESFVPLLIRLGGIVIDKHPPSANALQNLLRKDITPKP